ncbi:MAG: hypothetical protein JSR17_06940 [Proteobacteria bacterium]|nr:hypothetical protein [Pseudomonadota bacterium]
MPFQDYKNALSSGVIAGGIAFVMSGGNPLLSLTAFIATTGGYKVLPTVFERTGIKGVVKSLVHRANFIQNDNSNTLTLATTGAGIGYALGGDLGAGVGAATGAAAGTAIQDDEVLRCGKKTRKGCGGVLIRWGHRIQGTPIPNPKTAAEIAEPIVADQGVQAADDDTADRTKRRRCGCF